MLGTEKLTDWFEGAPNWMEESLFSSGLSSSFSCFVSSLLSETLDVVAKGLVDFPHSAKGLILVSLRDGKEKPPEDWVLLDELNENPVLKGELPELEVTKEKPPDCLFVSSELGDAGLSWTVASGEVGFSSDSLLLLLPNVVLEPNEVEIEKLTG